MCWRGGGRSGATSRGAHTHAPAHKLICMMSTMHIIFVLCTLVRYISKYNMPNTIYRRTCHCGNQYTAVCQCTAVLTTASIDKYAGRGPRCGGLQLLGQHAVLRGGAVQRDAVGRRPVARGVGAHVPVQPRSVPPLRVDPSQSESIGAAPSPRGSASKARVDPSRRPRRWKGREHQPPGQSHRNNPVRCAWRSPCSAAARLLRGCAVSGTAVRRCRPGISLASLGRHGSYGFPDKARIPWLR